MEPGARRARRSAVARRPGVSFQFGGAPVPGRPLPVPGGPMTSLKIALLAGALSLPLLGGPGDHSTRQFYGSWKQHAQHGYHFRPYYYKPSPNFHGFKHHYVIHHPKHPQHL